MRITANIPQIKENINFTKIHGQFTIICVHKKNKLFSVVNVAVNKSKTSCHQVIISFWRCKGTTFPRGIVRFSPFQSSKAQVSAMVNAGICIRQRRYLRRPMKVSAMRDEDYKRDSVTVYYIWFSRKRKLTSYIVSEFPVIGIFYI